MKNFFTALLVFSQLSLFALYNGNPAEPELIDQGFFISECSFVTVKAGYQGDFIFDRKLHAKNGSRGRIDEFEARFDQGTVTLNLMNRFEAYGSVGSMHAYFSHRPHIDREQRIYQTNDHLAWGVGGRAVLFNWEAATFGFDAKYQCGYPHVKWNTINGDAFTTGAELHYHEWQVGAGASYECNFFIPYAAFKYSVVNATLKHIRANMELGTSRFKMKSREHFGLSLGCSLSPGKYFDFNVEVQLFDEQGLTLAGNVQF